MCVYFWSGMVGQTGEQTQKMKGGGPLGSSEINVLLCLGGLDLLIPSSQGTHSCGRRGNVLSGSCHAQGGMGGRGSAGEERDRDGRNIYVCRCVFCTAFTGGNSCQISRYLDDLYTWKLQQPDEASLVCCVVLW